MLFSGRAHPTLAQEVADLLETELVPTTAYDFANGEIYVRFDKSVRGCDAFVIQSHTAPINERDHGAAHHDRRAQAGVGQAHHGDPAVLRLCPAGQEASGREPISARLMADLFLTAGADRLMTVDLHTAQIQGFFDGPVDHLLAMPILTRHVRKKYGKRELAVVSPDAGRIKVAESWARPAPCAAGVHPQDARPAQAERVEGQSRRR